MVKAIDKVAGAALKVGGAVVRAGAEVAEPVVNGTIEAAKTLGNTAINITAKTVNAVIDTASNAV